MKYTIGIDIGGTNIDMVAVDRHLNILSSHKQIHTQSFEQAITLGLKKLLGNALIPQNCQAIHLGTTIGINSILEEKNLVKVGVLRLSAHQPEIPPAYQFPKSLQEKILAGFAHIRSGFEYNKVSMGKIHPHEVQEAVERLYHQGAQSIAIVGCFSPLYHEQEQQVAQIIQETKSLNLNLSLSHHLGGLGYIQRENHTILNASLQNIFRKKLIDLQRTLDELGFSKILYITQNNGCLMTVDEAIQFPIKTIASGPTNSFIGASQLAKLKNAIIIDIGGTSTDIGIIENGFPRYSLESAKIAGVNSEYLLPEVQVIALGGGSLIEIEKNQVRIGPKSLGADLFNQSLSFGGKQISLHDVSEVLHHRQHFSEINLKQAHIIMNQVRQILINKLENIKKVNDFPIIIVGGGASLIPNSYFLPQMQRPQYHEVANAYGAALAEISSSMDEILELGEDKLERLKNLENQLILRTQQKGAQYDKIRIIQKDMTPLYYMNHQLTRIRMTASGPKKS